MNALVPVSQGLVPTSMSEAMKLAEMMAGAKLVPQALQSSPADCLMVIQQAVRWQMDPFAVAQECSVIQGKLMHSGKLVAAVVNARGNLVERLSYEYSGEGDNRTITVSGRLHGEAAARSVTVKLRDARTNNRVWQTQPDQQLMYHGCRVWARRHTPELMLGVYSPEEFDETTNGRDGRAYEPPKPAPLQIAQAEPEIIDAETGEIGPRELPLHETEKGPNWIAFGQALIAAVKTTTSAAEVGGWLAENDARIKAMREQAPKVAARMEAAIEEAKGEFAAPHSGETAEQGDDASEPDLPPSDASSAPDEMGPDESQEWRKRCIEFFKGATTIKAVETYWRNNVEPRKDDAFPGDVGDVERARDAALKRINGDG